MLCVNFCLKCAHVRTGTTANNCGQIANCVAINLPLGFDRVLAALLHDVVEDQDVTNAEVAAEFGASVASIVAEVTDDKSLAKKERKRLQVASAPHKSKAASIIKLADKTANLRALANSPPPWPAERKTGYVGWARSVVSGLPVKPAPLMAPFETAANAALATITP